MQRLQEEVAVNAPHVLNERTNPVFEFHALAGLPCGCIAAAYRSYEWAVAMVSLEAKGPHCVLRGHQMGEILQLNDIFDASQLTFEVDAG